MRITILTLGTHGDVQPFVALGIGLQRAGHTVRLAARDRYREFVTRHGLEFASLGPEEEPPRPASLRRLPGAMLRMARIAGSFLPRTSAPGWPERTPWLDRLIESSWAACRDAEVIVAGVLFFWVCHLAEKLNVPCFLGLLQPLTPTRRFPSLFFSARVPSWVRLGGGFNRLTHRVVARIFCEVGLRLGNAGRREILRLPPLTDAGQIRKFYDERATILYAYSPTLMPKPADWPARHHVTGFWFLDHHSDWRPPADLAEFLSAGPAPVCVGFGSFADRNPERLTGIVLEALARTGQRGILLTGWGGLTRAELPPTVFPIDFVPHDWLFPRMAAVIHHSGAGTTGAVLRAGVPAVTIPWHADHPFFAECAWALGTTPRPIPKRRLSAARLAAAIDAAVNDPRLRERAAAVARQIRSEDGVARAVEALESAVGVRCLPAPEGTV